MEGPPSPGVCKSFSFYFISAVSFLFFSVRSSVCPGLVCVVKPDGVPLLCQTDEIGELCVCSVATGTSYYGLTGMTKNTFEVRRRCTCGSPCWHCTS